jgi:hypothetical protein
MDDNEWLKDYVDSVSVSYCVGERFIAKSKICSIDVNDHIAMVIEEVKHNDMIDLSSGRIDVFYRGKRMFAGDGPHISRESISMIAAINAELCIDGYCMCNRAKGS